MATKQPGRFKLTQAREQWAEQRNAAPMFRGTVLTNNAAVSSRYLRRLQALVAQMTAQTNREIRKLFEGEAASAYFAQDQKGQHAAPFPSLPLGSSEQPPSLGTITWAEDARSVGSEARILVNSLQAKFRELFAKRAKALAESMVSDAEKVSASNMHASMQKLSGGLSLKTSGITPQLSNIYKASVAENVALIKSIPQRYMDEVQGAVMRSITTGNGLQDLVPALQKYEGVTHRRAKTIALDQTRKAYNSINRSRMEAIGIKRYEWIHSGGSDKPRQEHIEMSGNIYRFDDPPVIDSKTGERGIPGQLPNCRCTMRPVFDFSDADPEKSGE